MSELIWKEDAAMAVVMMFPNTVEEFMEEYKVVDTDHVYSNGTEYVPIYRMRQWFDHIDAVEVVRCRECVYYEPLDDTRPYDCPKGLCGVSNDDYCSYGERSENVQRNN